MLKVLYGSLPNQTDGDFSELRRFCLIEISVFTVPAAKHLLRFRCLEYQLQNTKSWLLLPQ